MIEGLRHNIRVNLQFYRRNRLLLIVGLLFLAGMLLTMIPSLFFVTSNERFQLAMQVYGGMYAFLFVISGLIALISIWYHRSNRCLKMIFTKPYRPEAWVVSHYAAVTIVFWCGMILSAVLYTVLSLAWGIPPQAGVLADMVCKYATVLLVYSYLLALSSWVHPIVALVLLLVFSDSTFYWLTLLCRAGSNTIEQGFAHYLLVGMDKGFCAVYYVLPSVSPFGEQLSKLSTGFRLTAPMLKYVAGHLVYAALGTGLCYLLVVYSLRRRQMT